MKFYLDKNGKINSSLSDILPDDTKEVTFEEEITPSDYNNDINAGGDKYIIKKSVVRLRPLTSEEVSEHQKQKRLTEIENEITQTKANFATFMDKPIQFLNGNWYKPKWADDGTYAKLIMALQLAQQLGKEANTILIWDATEKEENAVQMGMMDLVILTEWLKNEAEPVYVEQKQKISVLKAELAEIEAVQ